MTQFGRRRLLKNAAAAGMLAATGFPLRASPKRGGDLRLGIGGAHKGDSWDSRTHADSFMIMAGHGAVFDTLTQVAADGRLVGELAESWEASADARIWTFKLREGVRFHNGKGFDAEDVIASLALHVAPEAASPAWPIVSAISRIEAPTAHELRITLAAGNADFPFLLSDYHLCIYPAGQIADAMTRGIGTGMYQVDQFVAGSHAVLSRVADHYKDGTAGWFDRVELIAINEATARITALSEGRVDAINRVDVAQVARLRANPKLAVSEVVGNQHFAFPLPAGLAGADQAILARALKHSVARQGLVDDLLLGHGSVAMDTPIGPANQYFTRDLPVADYDPFFARDLLRRAGLEGMALDLTVSRGAFPGAIEAAQVVQTTAKAAGLSVNLNQVASDGYWERGAKPKWAATHWAGRATEDWMFSTAYQAGAPWNDSGWSHVQFQQLLMAARSELDAGKRRALYHDMQVILSEHGNTVIPVFANFIDGHTVRLNPGAAVGNLHNMDSGRMIERWWFS